MSGFSLHPLETEALLETRVGDPSTRDQAPAPGFFEGSLGATGRGALAALAGTRATIDTLGEYLPDSFFDDDDTFLPMNAQERETGSMIRRSNRPNPAAMGALLQDLRPDPQITGILGQVTYGLGSVLPPAIVGGLAGGPLGAAAAVGSVSGVADYQTGLADGLDPNTAQAKALLTGATNAVGAVLPASLGSTILTRIGSGVALNVPLGMAQRGATAELLRANGYDAMAEQYQAFSGTEILIDAVTGAAFGALPNGQAQRPNTSPPGEGTVPPSEGTVPPTMEPTPPPAAEPTQPAPVGVLPSDIDLSLSANAMNQFEIDAAPGIPTTPAARNGHVRAMDTAYSQLMRNEPVNVSDVLTGEMLPKPENNPLNQALNDALDEGGYGDLVREADALRNEAETRAVPLGEDLMAPPIDLDTGNLYTRAVDLSNMTVAARPFYDQAIAIRQLVDEGRQVMSNFKLFNRNSSVAVQKVTNWPTRPLPMLEWVEQAGGIKSGLTVDEANDMRARGVKLTDYYAGEVKDLFDGRKGKMNKYVKHDGLSIEDELPALAAEQGYLGEALANSEYRMAHPEEAQQRFYQAMKQAVAGKAIYDYRVSQALDEALMQNEAKVGLDKADAADTWLDDLNRYGLESKDPTVPQIAEALARQSAEARDQGLTPFQQRTVEYTDMDDAIPFMRAGEVETPAFKNWFGASKIVDSDGKPLVVYHGTNRDFEAFSAGAEQANDAGFFGQGFYFTPEKGEANYYGSKVGSYYLKIENPLDMTNDSGDLTFPGHFRAWYPKLKALGVTTPEVDAIYRVDAEMMDFVKANARVLEDVNGGYMAMVDHPVMREMDSGRDYLNKGAPTPAAAIERLHGRMIDEMRFYREQFPVDMSYYPSLSDYVRTELPGGARALSDAVKKAGHDGIMYGDEIVAFEPTQIKSTENIGTFDPEDARVRFMRPADAQDVNPLGFYSQLSRVANMKLPGKGSAEDFTKALDAYAKQGDFKPEELEYSGVKEWLSTQERVSKADVLDFLGNGGVKLEEVTLTRTEEVIPDITPYSIRRDIDGTYNIVDDNRGVPVENFETQAEAQAAIGEYLNGTDKKVTDNTKYGKYTLLGGNNYREVLLTLPMKENDWVYNRLEELQTQVYNAEESGDMERANRLHQEALALAEDRTVGDAENTQYRSSHWSQPNVLVHFRLADNLDWEGKRVLLIEEIQSDWHQAGRKKGYKSPESDARAVTAKAAFEDYSEELAAKYVLNPAQNLVMYATMRGMKPEEVARYEELQRVWLQSEGENAGVPDAPFKKTWAELSLKRILRMAAEKGYQKVAWTTGEIQAERYDLSKQISKVEWRAEANSQNGQLKAYGIDGRMVMNEVMEPAKVEDYIGKEVAKRLFEQPDGEVAESGQSSKMLEGVNLKVGGEGMKGFYDDILPKTVGKVIGKLDKAAKVSDVYLGGSKPRGVSNDDASTGAAIGARPLHGFDVTDELRERVMLGLPQFYRASGGTLPEGLERVAPGLAAEAPGRMSADDMLVAEEVNAMVQRMLPGAETRVSRRLFSTGEAGAPGEVFGAFRRPLNVRESRGVIDWSLAAPDAKGVARHEVIHGLREAGLFAPDEWDALTTTAVREDWAGQMKVSDAYRASERLEEAIAEKFRTWRQEAPDAQVRSVPGTVWRAFTRMAALLDHVGAAARRWMGLKPTAADVFARVETGEVGRRGDTVKAKEPAYAVTQAEQILADKPGTRIPDDSGAVVDGKLAMMDATADAMRAEQFGPLYEIAVNCFMRG